MIDAKLELVKAHKSEWDKEKIINVGNNKLYKVIGIGPKAFKISWFGKVEGCKKPVWNQNWWYYNDLDEIGVKVLDKLYKELSGGQTTL